MSGRQSSLVLIRHGQSTYNEKNLFTGWEDVELTKQGINEAQQVVPLISNLVFTHAFTSKLIRAQHTLEIILKGIHQELPVIDNIALNERDYGELVGQNKLDAAEKYGTEQVQIWRRSYGTPPPDGESLRMTANRTIPYFTEKIEPLLEENNTIIISAHGNSIRSIVMYLHKLSNEQILKTEIGWCEPWVYKFDDGEIAEFNIISRPGFQSYSHLQETSVELI